MIRTHYNLRQVNNILKGLLHGSRTLASLIGKGRKDPLLFAEPMTRKRDEDQTNN